MLMFHPMSESLRELWVDGWHCAYHVLMPQQMLLMHFKKTSSEFKARYDGGTWRAGTGWGLGKNISDLPYAWGPTNKYRNYCALADRTHTHTLDLVLDRLVREREMDFSRRAHHGPYCFAGACRRHFLAVMALAKGEENYTLEWVDFHLAAGADLVLLYVDVEGEGADVRYEFTRDLLQGHVKAGLVQMGNSTEQGPAFHDAFLKHRNDTWWLARLDMDAFLYSPLDGSVFDFLASTTNSGVGPEQYLVPRYDMGDSGHTRRPGDFMARAYVRATPLPEIFQAIMYLPAGQAKQADERSPHTFGDAYESCEAILRFGPLLFCFSPRWKTGWMYYIGWPGSGVRRLDFVSGGSSAHVEDARAMFSASFWSQCVHVGIALSCSLCLALRVQRNLRVNDAPTNQPGPRHLLEHTYGRVRKDDDEESS